ncbi:MAG: oligosaccharide flippase family protein [Planctomycetota bacterium]
MTTTTTGGPPRETRDDDAATQRHIRGSSLLFAGRLIALLINFVGQVLTVRYLTKGDYGAFSWALSVVSVAVVVNLSGVSRAVSRLMPAFDERGDRPAARGTLVLAVGTVFVLGTALVCLTLGGRALLSQQIAQDPLSVELLLVVVLLVPLQAFDHVMQELAAFLVGARAIFFRRHLLGPLLKLAVVLAVLALQADVRALAIGYVIAGAIGVAAYAWVLRRAPSARWLWQRGVRLPGRTVSGYAVPMLVTDLVGVLGVALAVIVVESYRGTVEVASYRAVVPVAGLILVVLQSFRFLFMPLASRLHARGADVEVGELYWRTTLWIAVLSFPVFAVCFMLAEPAVWLLFGERYAGSAELLALLSVGFYCNSALGLNSDSLQACGRMRFLVGVSLTALAVRCVLLFALVPSLGAFGAAISTALTAVVHNVLNQLGVLRVCGFAGPPASCRVAFGRVGGAAAVLVLAQAAWGPPLWAGALLAACAAAFVLAANRQALDLGSTFPELARVPFVGRLLGGP